MNIELKVERLYTSNKEDYTLMQDYLQGDRKQYKTWLICSEKKTTGENFILKYKI